MSLENLVGMTVQEGEEYLSKNEVKNPDGERVQTIRPMCMDGEEMMGTMDFRPDRVNVAVTAGKISEIRGCS